MKGLKVSLSVFCLLVFFLMQTALAWGAEQKVISWGADLTVGDREKIWSYFPAGLKEEKPIEVILTNQEERSYLQGLVPDKVIGSRAISSIYVEILPAGSGVQVETKNINWVNQAMFANALVTAGVKDARVMAVAPYSVSGTAALAGIFKGFETATGKKLDNAAKKMASEELITTGNLGEAIGDKAKAAELISKVKEEVVKKGLNNPEDIRQVIEEIAKQLNLNLTPEQIKKIIDLMKGIGSLHLDLQQISSQLKVMSDNLQKVLNDNQEVKGWLEKIYSFLQNAAQQIMAWLGQYMASQKG